MKTILQINNIEVRYSDFILVLKGLSLGILEGRIVALLGSNGAGKSTTIRAITGLLKPANGRVTRGEILFKNRNITSMKPDQIVRMGIAQVFEGRRIFDELTVDENLLAGAYTSENRKRVDQDIQQCYAYFPVLKQRSKSIAGYMSGGEQQMLAIGRALMSRPELLLLDEPSLGLAPLIARELFAIIRRINGDMKSTIFLVEQNANLTLGIASYGYVMENGRVVLDGTAKELLENRNVQEFYLGLRDKGRRKSFREVKHYKRNKRWFSS